MNTFCAGKVIEPTEKEATLEKKIYIYKSREGEEVSFQKPVGCSGKGILQFFCRSQKKSSSTSLWEGIRAKEEEANEVYYLQMLERNILICFSLVLQS